MEAAGQDCDRILAGFFQKGPNSENVLFPLCFPYRSIENLELTKILVLVWFQNLVLFW